MRVIRSIKAMRIFSANAKRQKKTIGFVPTMGFLHDGHAALLRRAGKENDITVLSVFVNPKQFLPAEDFSHYPRDFKKDEYLAKKEKVDIMFYPSEREIYPTRYLTHVQVDEMTEVLCGKFRPGHFKGVTTVVAKLLNIVFPDRMYLGQKDAQQAIVLKKMIEDLNFPVEVRLVATVREKNGLALSSRNAYLSAQEKDEATVLLKALTHAKQLIDEGERNPHIIRSSIAEMINRCRNAKINYIECVDAKTLRPLGMLKGNILIALAVWFGKARLIDNMVVKTR